MFGEDEHEDAMADLRRAERAYRDEALVDRYEITIPAKLVISIQADSPEDARILAHYGFKPEFGRYIPVALSNLVPQGVTAIVRTEAVAREEMQVRQLTVAEWES
jgi:hypothetical protein